MTYRRFFLMLCWLTIQTILSDALLVDSSHQQFCQ